MYDRFRRWIFSLACWALLSLPAMAVESGDDFYPPGRDQALPIGEEAYKDKSLSLRGLEGVHVVLDYVTDVAENRGLALSSDLEKKVRARFARAGLLMLSKHARDHTPGQPQLDFFPSLPRFEGTAEEQRIARLCCEARMWVSFTQGTSLLREPEENFRLASWGEGAATSDCGDLGGWLEQTVLEKVDAFLGDYKVAHSGGTHIAAPAKLAVQRTVYPQSGDASCPTEVVRHHHLFASDASEIRIEKLPMLRELADQMKRCSGNRYLVETHADRRGGAEYNDALTARRAAALTRFLLANDVPQVRFLTLSHGKRVPIVKGTDDIDHEKNRRVEITPFRVE